jgi:amino acid transporter
VKAPRTDVLVTWLFAVAVCALLAIYTFLGRLRLEDSSSLTGWVLVFLFVFLSLFNVRKRFPMIPLGSARRWLLLHAVMGILALAAFWFHAGSIWPQGLYERLLTLFFYALTLNGIAGYVLQRVYPPRLTQTGLEVIYERIPVELAQIRDETESIILKCTKETGNDTLARHYLDTLDWFFRRPRFGMSHCLGGQQGNHWIRQQFVAIKRYLNDEEAKFLDQLESLAHVKNRIDFHYAAQGVMKGWLFIHIPFTVATLTFGLWHVILIHVYAL